MELSSEKRAICFDSVRTDTYAREQLRQARALNSIEKTADAIKYTFMGVVAASAAALIMVKVAPHFDANSSTVRHYISSPRSVAVQEVKAEISVAQPTFAR